MNGDMNTMTDERMELIIGNLLRVMVSISAVFVAAGGALYLIRHGIETPDYGVFQGVPKDLRDLRDVFAVAGDLKSLGIIQLGLLILIATPVVRVIFSVFAFLLERDSLYALVASIVLSVLLLSITGVLT